MKKRLIYLIAIMVCILPFGKAQTINDTISLKTIEIIERGTGSTAAVTNTVTKNEMNDRASRDVGEFLRSIPNVSGIRKGGSALDPVVRGFKFSQINVVLDGGMKIENGCPNRMDPATSHVETEELSEINVAKGPHQLSYGPAMGGVINLQTENPQPFSKFEIHGNAMFGYESNWEGAKEYFSLYGGNSRIYFRASGGYRSYGDYSSGGSEELSLKYNSSFRKFNYGGKLGFVLTPKQNILLSYSEVHGRDVMFPALTMDEKSDDTKMMSFDYSYKDISGIIQSVDVKVYRTDVHHIMDNSNRETWASKQMVADVDALNTGGKAVMRAKIGDGFLSAGVDYEDIFKDGARAMSMMMMGTTSTKMFSLWKDASIQNAGFFTNYNTSFGNSVLEASLRLDYNMADSEDTLKLIKDGVEYFNKTDSRFFNVSGNLGFTQSLTEKLSLSASLARGSRSPNMLERYIKLLGIGYDSYDYLGNPQLKPETNNQADLTLRYVCQKSGDFYVNGFYSYVQDYISAVLLPSSVVKPGTMGAPGVKQFVNVDKAVFTGFELGFKSAASHKLVLSVVAAYTYAFVPEVTKYIIQDGKVTGDTLIKNDALPEIPPFESTIGLGYRFLKGKLIPSLALRYVAAQKHVSQAFYEAETPGFTLLNFSVSYRMNKNISLNAGVNNLFNTSYYEHLNRRMTGTTDKLYEPGRSFFINLNLAI